MIDVAGIEKHYQAVGEGPRLVRSRVRKLEFDTTLHFLELGAGDGAYSLHFARRGHRVLATDLVEANVRAMAARVEAEGLGTMEVRQADATRLDALSDWDFQAVLCLGPYYHLRTRELRRRCLLECRRVVHSGGVVAVAYINRAFAVGHLIKHGVFLSRDQYQSIQSLDDTRTDYPDAFFNITHFTTPEAVEAEVKSCGFTIVEHLSTDGPYEYFSEAFAKMDEEAYLDFFSYHLKTCGQPSQLGAGNHGLVILKKT